MAGHIKLDRKIINWEWYCDVNVAHLFIYLILKANFKEGKWRGILVKRGQLITGRLKVSKDTGLSEMQIRTCLNKLKLTKEIITEVTNRFTIITICKYDVYQSLNNEDNQQNNQQITNESSNKYPTDNQQITTIEEELRRKKKNKEGNYGEENFKINTDIYSSGTIGKMTNLFLRVNPSYPVDLSKDSTAILQIATKIGKMQGLSQQQVLNGSKQIVLESWENIVEFIVSDKWFSTRSLFDLNNEWQRIIQSMSGIKVKKVKTSDIQV